MDEVDIDFSVSKTGRKIRKDSFEAKHDMKVVVRELKSPKNKLI